MLVKVFSKGGYLSIYSPKYVISAYTNMLVFPLLRKGLSDPFLQPAESSQLCINKKETYAGRN